MLDQTPQAIDGSAEVFDECPIAARIPIDYDEILADFEPGAPGGRIVFSTADYATEQEAEAAHEAFYREIWEAPDEED